MTEPVVQGEDAVEFDALERLIRRADGFALAFARVNRPARRRALADDLRQRLDGDVRVVDVDFPPDTVDIQYLLARVYEEVASEDVKTALFVTGIERVLSSARERTGFLPVLNFKRENLQRSVPCPVVLWLPEFALRHVALGAPDVWAWRSGVFEFASEREETDRDWETLRPSGSEDEYARMTPDERRARIETLEALYADYEPHADDPATALIRADLAGRLARLYRYVPDFEAALDRARKTLATRERVLGPDHPSTVASITILAHLLHMVGDYVEAEPLLRRSLDEYEAALGPNHPNTLSSINNLAGLLRDKGDLEAAELLYRRALSERERVLGPGHPHTLHSAGNLAKLFQKRGDLVSAEPLYRRAFNGHESLLGSDHTDTLTSINNLAIFLHDKGDFEAAESLSRRAIEGYEASLGPDHLYTLTSVNNLANILQRKGDLDAAEPLLRRAFDGFKRVLGADHPNTKLVRDNLDALLAERDA